MFCEITNLIVQFTLRVNRSFETIKLDMPCNEVGAGKLAIAYKHVATVNCTETLKRSVVQVSKK